MKVYEWFLLTLSFLISGLSGSPNSLIFCGFVLVIDNLTKLQNENKLHKN